MIVYVIVSFLLDGICSNEINSPFLPLFTLTSLIIIKPNSNSKWYLSLCIITGLLYDIVYTDTLFFHTITFPMIGFLTGYLRNKYNLQKLKEIPLVILGIISYRLFSYSFYLLVQETSFSMITLTTSILSSILLNLCYTLLFLLIVYHREILAKF